MDSMDTDGNGDDGGGYNHKKGYGDNTMIIQNYSLGEQLVDIWINILIWISIIEMNINYW